MGGNPQEIFGRSFISFAEPSDTRTNNKSSTSARTNNNNAATSQPKDNQSEFCNMFGQSFVSFAEPLNAHISYKSSASARTKNNTAPPSQPKDNQSEFCNTCQLLLTSRVVAEQHYAGQKHKKNASKNQMGPIGQHELNKPAVVPPSRPLPTTTTNTASTPFKFNFDPNMAPYLSLNNHTVKCELCFVQAPNNQTFEAHLSGKRHRKLLEAAVAAAAAGKVVGVECCNNQSVDGIEPMASISKILTNLQQQAAVKSESSVAGTELKTGFSCEICQVSMSCEEAKKAHLEGKKHLKKVRILSGNLDPKTIEEEDKKFAHLAVAWHKYTIPADLKLQTSNLYEYYCHLCKKFIQRKLQLIDHLKSQKHHNMIFEMRRKQPQLPPHHASSAQFTSPPSLSLPMKRQSSDQETAACPTDSKRVKF